MPHGLDLHSVVNVLAVVEPLLTLLALCVFVRAKDHLRFPALRNFLILRVVSNVALAIVYNLTRFGMPRPAVYHIYFYLFYGSYLAGAIAIFFVIQEMFRFVMAPLPGISRLGLFAFRWAATISMIVAIASAVLPAGFRGRMIMATSIEFMRCISIMELCLLVLLAFSVHSLGLSFRSRAFGVGLGLGLMAFMDFMTSVFTLGQKNMNNISNVIGGTVAALVFLIWTGYFFLPEAERKPITLPMNSQWMRLNEIVMALGRAAPVEIAPLPSSQFFLQDVENVVDEMLRKNSMKIVK